MLRAVQGTLYDVTHLPCRSARYMGGSGPYVPSGSELALFPVSPGAKMPALPGRAHKDYAVVFVTAVEDS